MTRILSKTCFSGKSYIRCIQVTMLTTLHFNFKGGHHLTDLTLSPFLHESVNSTMKTVSVDICAS